MTTSEPAGTLSQRRPDDAQRVAQVPPVPAVDGSRRHHVSGRPRSLAAGVLAVLTVLLTAVGVPTAATAAAGTVVAWGYNVNGQTSVPAGLGRVTAVAAGYSHSLALKSDGTVVAWGANGSGETSVPAGLTGVTAIAAGRGHSSALKSDGTVVAWGSNANVPAGLSGVTAIAAGHGHSLALKFDGTVVAWGDDSRGQASVPAGLSGVTAIAAGSSHSVALTSDGTVVGWGWNEYGQASGAGLTGVAAIAAGGYHSLALKSDGTVVAWGWHSYGITSVPAGLSGVTAIAGGVLHSLALKSDGTVVDWGYIDEHESENVPAGLNRVIAISAGFHNLALQAPLDDTPPTVTLSAAGAVGPAGWYNAASSGAGGLTVTATASDPSGVVGLECIEGGTPVLSTDAASGQFTLPDGRHQVSCTATDQAGNAGAAAGSTPMPASFDVDQSAPTLAPTVTPDPVLLGGAATAAPNAGDAASGVVSAECATPATDTAGPAAVTCTATDTAGNTAAATARYLVTYAFSGFQAPIDNAPTVNTGKAGRTYPVKWQLTDASGGYVSALNAATSISYKPTSCSAFSTDPTDAIETTAAGGTTLRYDATSNQYVYNWATPSKSGCYILIITLADTTTHAAYFQVR